jgi:hypothetical protein
MRILIILLLLSSCDIETGYIIQKKIKPAHSYTYTTFQTCGKTLIPIVHNGYAEDEYILIIKNQNKTNEIEVNKTYYSKCNIGEWYNKNLN